MKFYANAGWFQGEARQHTMFGRADQIASAVNESDGRYFDCELICPRKTDFFDALTFGAAERD